jgi:hypothetical protein
MSHAPGTWGVRNGTLSIYTNYGGSTYHKVADARQPLFTRECQDANARLIAAAPDLLAALEWWQAQMQDDNCDDMGKLLDEMTAKAREAIAQVKGA